MIVEAILGVCGTGSTPRFAPMGVLLTGEENEVLLRPFASSKTGALLLEVGQGTLNFTDDVCLFALTALSDVLPPSNGALLEGACSWWNIGVKSCGKIDSPERWEICCRVLERGARRDFSPFNRAMYAVIEATVLATRAHCSEDSPLDFCRKLDELEAIVRKTGGRKEVEAFAFVRSKLS